MILIKGILDERSSKISITMRMMGLRQESIWLSWLLTYIFIFILNCFVGTAVLKVALPFKTNFGYIFILLFLFSFATISLGFLMCSLFDNSRAALQVSILIYFVGYGLYYYLSTSAVAYNPFVLCLFAPSCLGVGLFSVGHFEESLIGIKMSNANQVVNGISFNSILGMLLADFVIYMVLAWYLNKVRPSVFGTKLPWYFVFQPINWSKKILEQEKQAEMEQYRDESNPFKDYYEPYPEQLKGKDGLKLRKLTKVWKGEKGEADSIAVNSISIDFLEGQVVALLGENGAGKSSLLSILSGLTGVTFGSARVFGYSIRRELHRIFQLLGVCPQKNTLFKVLTPMEHLFIFARLKGVTGNSLRQRVLDSLNDVGLLEIKDQPVMSLSEGQMRSLSVAIAFIGNPKMVLLDEPTASMDISARRKAWDLIRRNKESRVVVLCTHLLDEADLLGDRIAFMSKGKLACFGTSLFLKSKYGVGYSIAISSNTLTKNVSAFKKLIGEHLKKFKFINSEGGELMIQTPFEESVHFPALFRRLDDLRGELNISTYSVAVTTLEEVFLKIADDSIFKQEDIAEARQLVKQLSSRGVLNKKYIDSPTEGKSDLESPIADFLEDLKGSPRLSNMTLFFNILGAMLYKRFHHAKRERSLWFYLSILPAINIVVGLVVVVQFYSSTFRSVSLSLNQFSTPVPLPISTTSSINALLNSSVSFPLASSSVIGSYFGIF
jgi:ATP-binding cassette subfamily A (ABC1) protein 3